MTKLIDAGWFPPLLASSIASLMLTWRIGWQLLEQERSKPRRREDEFSEGAVTSPPIRLPGAAAILTEATTGILLWLIHHLKHNRALFIAAVSLDEPRVEAASASSSCRVGAGMIRVIFCFGFIETADVLEGLRLACRLPELRGINPENITYYFRQVMVIASAKPSGMPV